MVDQPPATKHVLGSNECRVFCRVDERTGRRTRDRRDRQPGQGRRGPGDPGLQRASTGCPSPPASSSFPWRRSAVRSRPRPAPASPAPQREARRCPPRPIPCSSRWSRTCRPWSVPRACPAGFAAVGTTAGIKASGPGPRARRGGPEVRSRRPRCSRRNRFAAAPVQLSRANLRRPPAAARYGRVRRRRHRHLAAAPTRPPARRATPTRRRSAGPSRRPWASRPTEVLHLSTGVIGTRLPVDRVTAAIARVVAGGLAATGGGLAAIGAGSRLAGSADDALRPRRSRSGPRIPRRRWPPCGFPCRPQVAAIRCGSR